ncbi:MAG: methyltransferase domain-containing protein [Sphingobacteriaceae bacterium]|nr:methyltransferase domain-containing protein [Sphingobacteriaceae bacterium]
MAAKWYQNWFNSPYYHILYHQRNDSEAEFFIDNLCEHLKPAQESRMLDIACGKGRHSIYLNKKGFDVTGIDLSFSSIKYAKQFENERLKFFQHDMRNLLFINYFDLAFNLFTSFGYFASDRDNVNALKSFRKSLKKDGLLVLDYFNSQKILTNLTNRELKTAQGIDFNISKEVKQGRIIKSIEFKDKNKDYKFQEDVKAFSFADFEKLFKLSGFRIIEYFGNYSLDAFDEGQSDRLIFICSKTDA